MDNVQKEGIEKISNITGFAQTEIAIIQNTVAKGTTLTELAYFLKVAKSSGLNPFTKQIWCYKDNKGNVIIMAGRDGFLSIAQKSDRWNGMISSEVYQNDHFEVDVIKGEISHKPNYKERGALLGAYCLVKPKGVELATYEWAAIKDYDKGQFIWNSHKNEMIKKVAEIHALKKSFGIGGLYSEFEIIPLEVIKEAIENATDYDDIKLLQRQHPKISLNGELMGLIAKKKMTFQ
jgi:phage recombination protein Bet